MHSVGMYVILTF